MGSMIYWPKLLCTIPSHPVRLSNNLGYASKSAPPLNEVRIAKALPEYYTKYSQSENAKSDYLNRFSSKLSFEPSKPKGISL